MPYTGSQLRAVQVLSALYFSICGRRITFLADAVLQSRINLFHPKPCSMPGICGSTVQFSCTYMKNTTSDCCHRRPIPSPKNLGTTSDGPHLQNGSMRCDVCWLHTPILQRQSKARRKRSRTSLSHRNCRVLRFPFPPFPTRRKKRSLNTMNTKWTCGNNRVCHRYVPVGDTTIARPSSSLARAWSRCGYGGTALRSD